MRFKITVNLYRFCNYRSEVPKFLKSQNKIILNKLKMKFIVILSWIVYMCQSFEAILAREFVSKLWIIFEKKCLFKFSNIIKGEEAICKMKLNEGDCNEKISRWYFNQDKQSCLEFNYSGCNGNFNNFGTKAECEKNCMTGRKY